MGYLKRHPLIGACVALAALLVVVLGFETGWGTGIRPALPPPSGKPAAAADSRVLPPLQLGSADQAFPETASRPLFVPTRRPVPVAPASGPTTMAKGSLTLQGVIVVGEAKVAMLREKANGRIHRVEQGKEVNGMTVSQIERDRVLLKQGDDQEMVVMAVQKGGGAAAAAPHGGPFPNAGATPAGMANTLPVPNRPAQFGGPGGMPVPGSPAEAAPPPQAAPLPGAAGATGQTNASGPMTPEELLARRRARRNQQ